ncbi:hypothetical protein ACE1CI_18050 [Aerosakkonemataceae cyanobacterium BLCC-F50]|uniref:Baseplate protein J-like domain-containing protein n=1 Tax=Floridaenema flaviceps BLCC-F50 TaxID=3153642 RepID=A0ABV4XT15_9CYAN
MNSSSDRLYKLLPAIYRLRDSTEGKSLQALLALFEQELLTIEGDISDLYDNWFIETCAEWAVPYIGDLLDVQEFYADTSQVYGQQERRAYVANTISYRRRKGTVPVLEQLTQDVTGWRSRAVEFSRLVAITQNLNHIRFNSTTANLRANNQLQQIGTPFEQQAAYTADIRSVSQRGRYNVTNIGLFIYRLQSYPSDCTTARAVFESETNLTGRYYTFNPLGYKNIPLFNQPQTKTDILTLSEEINLPGILRRAALETELKQRHQSHLQGKILEGIRYFDNNPVLQIFVNGQPNPIPPEEMLICSLEADEENKSWNIPNQEFERNNDDPLLPTKVVAVDPELGRIAFLNQPWPKRVEVSCCYGFSGDIGGGSYSRNNTTREDLLCSCLSDSESSLLFCEVEQAKSADPNPLATAIESWNQTVEAWQGLRDRTHIPLAEITISTSPVTKNNSPENAHCRFTPGIVGKGLQVIVDRGSKEAIITPGTAVDYQGRRISILQTQRIDLSKIDLTNYPNGTVLLAISYQGTQKKQINLINFVPETAIDSYPKGILIPLVRLVLNGDRQLIEPPDFSVRPTFEPGIVQGWEVEIKPGTLEAVITPGKAVDERGRAIETINNHQFDLTLYQEKSGWLILSRKVGLFRKQYQFQFIPNIETNQQPNPNDLILAYLEIPKIEIKVDYPYYIVSGLEVKSQPEKLEITVTSGTAKNCNDKSIELGSHTTISLKSYQGQSVNLVLCPVKNEEKKGEVKVLLSEEPIAANPRDYIHLAYIKVSQANNDRMKPTMQVFPATKIVKGLGVNAAGSLVTIELGTAINGQGEKIELTRSYEFDLSVYLNQIQMWSKANKQDHKNSDPIEQKLVLFISDRTKQGLPIKPVNAKRGGWQHIGMVLQEPTKTKTGIIIIKDNRTFQGDLMITIPVTKELKIIATDNYCPHLQGNIFVRGTANADDPQQGKLILEGLLIEGQLTVQPGNLKQLCINHCTLVPQQGGIKVEPGSRVLLESEEEDGINAIALVTVCLSWFWESICQDTGLKNSNSQLKLTQLIEATLDRFKDGVSQISQTIQRWQYSQNLENRIELGSSLESSVIIRQDNASLEIRLYRSICGSIYLNNTVPKLTIEDSIIDKGQSRDRKQQETSGVAIEASSTDVEIKTTTVFGITNVRTLEASDSIFTEKVIAQRHQIGCIRFSYIPDSSETPRRYQCEPDMALKNELGTVPKAITDLSNEKHLIMERLQPSFTSKNYGDPGYAQLGKNCSQEIFNGAEDGAEMGAFNFLKQSQREKNLQASLKEYLRFGLQAGIFYIN